MKKISKYCSYSEATKSDTAIRLGINNEPNFEHLQNMQSVANKIFDVVREEIGEPLKVSSFFRNEALNRAIGGASSSQHTLGEAIDIDSENDQYNAEIFHFIKDNLVFDQLIWEFGDEENPSWVHVSLKRIGTNRGQVLKAVKEGKKTVYINFK